MLGLVVQACGGVAALIGVWRAFVVAREAIRPLVHEGDPTRTAIEATRPFPFRPRVQLFARQVAISVGWLVVATYGLYLIVSVQGLAS